MARADGGAGRVPRLRRASLRRGLVFIGLAALTVPHMLLESLAGRPALAAEIRRRVGVREERPPLLDPLSR